MNRARGRWLVLMPVALVLGALLGSSPAAASTLDRDLFRLGAERRAEFVFGSERAFANVVRVRRQGRSYLFTDTEPITVVAPCTLSRRTNRAARCPIPRRRHVVRIATGELRDRVSVSGSFPTDVEGGQGNDRLSGGRGPDILSGEEGRDRLRGGRGNDVLAGGLHNDFLVGGRGHDVLYGDEGRDRLFGGPGNDVLEGGPENDVLRGGPGNDDITGDDGNNLLSGGDGNDRLWATTRGRDIVSCGRGFDIAFVSHNDRVIGCERVFRITERRARR